VRGRRLLRVFGNGELVDFGELYRRDIKVTWFHTFFSSKSFFQNPFKFFLNDFRRGGT